MSKANQKMTKIKLNLHWIISIFICAALLFYALGCEPKTASLVDPEIKVDRLTIGSEIQLLLARSERAYEDLDRQIKIKNLIFQQGLVAVQGGTLNPIGILTTLMAIFGVGAATDDIRLRKKIKREKPG